MKQSKADRQDSLEKEINELAISEKNSISSEDISSESDSSHDAKPGFNDDEIMNILNKLSNKQINGQSPEGFIKPMISQQL